jgi:hypothetical protein
MALLITTPAPPEHGLDLCLHCHRNRVVFLDSMRLHSDLNWYKCDGCDHIFTLPRASSAAQAAR